MRLLFIIKGLVVPGGGAERVFVSVVNGLAARGHSIIILTLDPPDGETFYSLAEQCPTINLDLSAPGVSLPPRRLVRVVRNIREVAQVRRPDVVVAFMHSMYIPAAFALANAKIPLVASEHIDAAHFADRPLERILVSIARSAADCITVPVAAVRDELAPRLRKKTVVIPNPIDLEKFEAIAQPRSDAPHVVLAVGRFMEQKNHVALIEAFAKISDRFPSWKLRIVGEGQLRPLLERCIKKYRLYSKVELPGAIKDIASEFSAAQFFVMPSLYESFGIATAESLASSRAVLGFAKCTGTAELIEHGVNGYLLGSAGDSVDRLAEGLALLMSSPDLRNSLAANGPKSVSRFSLRKIIDEWEAVLNDVRDGNLLTAQERSESGSP